MTGHEGVSPARIDLHTHTCFSLYDGVLTPEELVDAARHAGLGGLAVTDHYDYDEAWMGAFAAREYARSIGGPVVWPGLEYTVEKGEHRGHLLVYFDDPDDAPARGLTAAELLDHCADRDLLTIHPHPFSAWGISEPAIIARSPYVELNGDHGESGPNARVKREAVRRGWSLVASSDAHDPRQLGSAWTEVPKLAPSLKDTLAASRLPILRKLPLWGIASKLARVATLPVTLPWNLARCALAKSRLTALAGQLPRPRLPRPPSARAVASYAMEAADALLVFGTAGRAWRAHDSRAAAAPPAPAAQPVASFVSDSAPIAPGVIAASASADDVAG